MLWTTEELEGLTLCARDGEIGRVRDVLFDDRHWVVRHLVVHTGGWLSGREVLVSPHAVQRLDREGGRVELQLTREQIENAPSIDTDQPFSRQQETLIYDYYGYPYYWAGAGLWGGFALPMPMLANPPGVASEPVADEVRARDDARRESGDPHLRSAGEVSGYALNATDGTIGRIDDFLFDGRSWQIEHVLVDSKPWWPGGQVVLPRRVLGEIDWARHEAEVRVSRQAVKEAPPWERGHAARDESMRSVQAFFERMV